MQIIVVLTIFTVLWVVLLCSYKTNIKVTLNGKYEVKTMVNIPYEDMGFKVIDENKEVDNYKYNNSSNVDITKLGEYKYRYEIEYRNKKYYLERKVIVVDEIAPELTIDTNGITRDYCTKKDTNSLKYSAIDNYDGDITYLVKVTEKDNYYIVSVSDSSNNKVEKEVPIKYSNKPKDSLKLNGNKTINVKLNDTYKEQGAKYTSGCSTKNNANIVINGEVDTTKAGTYELTYSYNGLSVKRKVVVYEPSTKQDTSNKIIYLTFDDGPSKYTPKLLDILDKYNVKATFFVVGTNRNTIAEEYKRGHTIGVHSLTHNWSIYSSLEAYLDDFNKMNDIIEQKTGSRSMIFRFPGGSSNTVSRKYSKGIVKKIANYMTDAGYVYFDWNVSAGDASSNTGEQVYKNVVNGVKNCTKCVILMHDSKQKTVNQVENILKTFIERGYTFGTLDTNGPIVHHNIKN